MSKPITISVSDELHNKLNSDFGQFINVSKVCQIALNNVMNELNINIDTDTIHIRKNKRKGIK